MIDPRLLCMPSAGIPAPHTVSDLSTLSAHDKEHIKSHTHPDILACDMTTFCMLQRYHKDEDCGLTDVIEPV